MPAAASTTAATNSTTTSANLAPAASTSTPINLPTDMLRNLKLNASLSIDHLTAVKLNLNHVALTLTDNNGLVSLSPATASLYEGTAKINGTLDVRNPTPVYSLNLVLANVQAESLLNDMTGKDFLAGTANFTMNVQTSANTTAELTSHLNGNGNFSLNNGVIKGVNINYLLAQAKSLINKTAVPAETSDNTTPFGQLTGTFTIVSGIVTNNVLLVNNPNFTVNGQGKADLNQLTMNYKLTINSSQLKGYKIPINVNGILTSPSIALDTQNILIQILNQNKNQLINKQVPQLLANASPQVQQAAKAALGQLLGQ
jgi:AsmA protein